MDEDVFCTDLACGWEGRYKQTINGTCPRCGADIDFYDDYDIFDEEFFDDLDDEDPLYDEDYN